MKKFVYALAVCLAACLPTGGSDNDDPDPVPEGEKVTLTEAGTLRTVLGDRALDVEAIDVEGPMDYRDLATLNQAACKGKLMSIDLSKATIQNNVIPDYTFCPYYSNRMDGIKKTATDHVHDVLFAPKFTCFVFPNTIESIGRASFSDSKLDELTLPTALRSIGPMAFCSCKNLKQDRLFFPEGLEKIGEGAFQDATLRDVVLPASLREIGAKAFDSAIAGNVYSHSPEPPVCLYDSAFDGCGNSTLYVPVGARASYAAVKGWSGFAKIVETKDFPRQR